MIKIINRHSRRSVVWLALPNSEHSTLFRNYTKHYRYSPEGASGIKCATSLQKSLVHWVSTVQALLSKRKKLIFQWTHSKTIIAIRKNDTHTYIHVHVLKHVQISSGFPSIKGKRTFRFEQHNNWLCCSTSMKSLQIFTTSCNAFKSGLNSKYHKQTFAPGTNQ